MIYSFGGKFRPSKIIVGGGGGGVPCTSSISCSAKVGIFMIFIARYTP